MKTNSLITRQPGTPASIVRQLIASASKTYVPEDVEKAVNLAILRFYQQMRAAAREELKFINLKKIPPKTEF